jgi:hypothetical protein
MSLNIIDARIVNKILTTGTPSIAPSSDHTDGTWIDTDAYIAELVLNTTDDKVWIMGENGPLELAVTTGATSGVFVSGGGTINRLPKFVGSTDIADSVISETGGVVRIDSTGNATTPVLTLTDTDTGFYRSATGSMNISCDGSEVMQWQDGLIQSYGDFKINAGELEVDGVVKCNVIVETKGLAVGVEAKTTTNYSITPSDSHITVTNGATNVIMFLPSTAGGSHVSPVNGQIISVTKIGASSGNVRLTTGLSGGMLNPGSTVVVDSFRIEGTDANTTVQMIYDGNLNKWITLSVMPFGNGIYDTTL